MGRCAKDKWNCINGDYKRMFDYHKGTSHNTSWWDLSSKEPNKFHFLKQFNEKCYKVIQAFQRERNINVAIHVRDLNAQGDGIYVHQNKEQEEHFPMQSSCSFMQELLGKDNVLKDSQDA